VFISCHSLTVFQRQLYHDDLRQIFYNSPVDLNRGRTRHKSFTGPWKARSNEWIFERRAIWVDKRPSRPWLTFRRVCAPMVWGSCFRRFLVIASNISPTTSLVYPPHLLKVRRQVSSKTWNPYSSWLLFLGSSPIVAGHLAELMDWQCDLEMFFARWMRIIEMVWLNQISSLVMCDT